MKKIALFVMLAGCMLAAAATPNAVTPPPVGRPMLVSPAGTVEDGDCVTFSWQASENAGGYLLQVSPAPDFIPSMTTEVNAGTSTTAIVKGLYPDKTYWWTVWARRTAKGRLAVRSFPANFRTAPRKDGQTCDGKLRPSLLPDACYMDDIPTLESTDFKRFIVQISDSQDVVFLCHKITGKWWMDMSFLQNDAQRYERHHFIPCSKEDYEQALRNELPDKWWQFYQKLM